ncbi:MAG TPA: hypothetical protein VGV38_22315, partial [Pyrinomonadaceae bacterium]|nr:hypothetical protein [Pyrinomonadaceae bacterium]
MNVLGDWIGLLIIVGVLIAGLAGLAHLSKPPKRLTADEFEKRVKESQGGTMTAGAAAALHALQKLMNPKAAEAVEAQKDLRAGYYDDTFKQGEGGREEETGEARAADE